MHYRWAHNKDFALGEFGKIILPDGDADAQRAAAEQASAMFQGAVPMLGATPDMVPSIEASYEGLLGELNTHFQNHDFLFGSRPSIGDFGLIGPLYAHQYRDPASGAIMKERAPTVVEWVLRMQEPPALSADKDTGAFLPDDAIPETLLPILKRMMREQGPCLVDLVHQIAAWKEANPNTDIPRMIGMHAFSIDGTTGQRLILPYTQWMLQRAMADFDTENIALMDFLEDIGGSGLASLSITAPVRRHQYKLTWA